MSVLRELLLAACVCCGLLLYAPSLVASPQHNSYLTSKASDEVPLNQPQRHFDCSDTVYVVIEATQLPEGKHILETEWKGPEGETREKTSHAFQSVGGFARVWSWLRLHGPDGVAASVARAFDPSLGMEAFIGEWSVRVELDDKRIATLNFEVLC